MKRTPLRFLVTAGPTREMLDPVRFLSNVSTGEMGYAIAREALRLRHAVTLVSGPTALSPPKAAKFVPITSARELKAECEKRFLKHDVLVMVAAVCDFTAPDPKGHKIRRSRIKQLRLCQTPDIVAGLARNKGGRTVIGFCLETEKWLENAKAKLKRKGLDGIVANYYSKTHVPFGSRKINTAFLTPGGKVKRFHQKKKADIARELLLWIEEMVGEGEEKKSFGKR